MKRPHRAPQPQFSHPLRQITLMLTVLVLVAAGGWVALPRVGSLFLANPWLNGFILVVFAIGILACFWQVFQISRSVAWIEEFTARDTAEDRTAPRLLAPLATLLGPRGARSRVTATSARSILDSVAARIDEDRDITRYIINLLVFLGLLGTFYGLAITVPAVVETIRSLAPTEGESSIAVFDRLMTGLEAQLGGMGTAFSTSLLGLAGSLVVGLLELFAGHGQNRFYRQLEEWVSSITRLGVAAGDGDGATDQGALVAMFEQMAEQIEALQEMQARMATDRQQADAGLARMAEAVERLAAGGGAEMTAALIRVAEGQERLAGLVEAQGGFGADDGADAEARMRLRSIDVHLLRILEEMAAGREETLSDLRSDIAHLTAAVRQVGRPGAGLAPLPGRKGS
ncbi:biopolymer transporter ExbB [Rhodobaculum claviforme]|uniref:Biopolymer transporter ExbB n=1 Tax=Rhodobaculum claviforme TaxID=1549854 RepID=A0A934TKR1_9RHOB|nr:biopolymer transporter ExbB [Rhodobaculum claviforme]MBK5927413.1 biopolymer transporter ExbB [Rhodobaculum claviforme]